MLIGFWVLQVAACQGQEGDATPFTDVKVDDVSEELHKRGYQRYGWEVMYNGHTGRQMQAQVYLNPTYYQRLKHMVDFKIHSRSRWVAHAFYSRLKGRLVTMKRALAALLFGSRTQLLQGRCILDLALKRPLAASVATVA